MWDIYHLMGVHKTLINWPKLDVLGKMGSKCEILFSRPPKGTSLRLTSVWFVEGWGFNPTLVDDDHPHWWLQSLVWGVGLDPPPPSLRKVQNPNSSLNPYELYENAPECTILKWKKNQKFSGEGACPLPRKKAVGIEGRRRRRGGVWPGDGIAHPQATLHPLGASTPLLFWQIEHCIWRTDRENRCTGLICMASPETKKLTESPCTRRREGAGRGRGLRTPYRIIMKFYTAVGVPDVITHAKFCGHRFWGFGDSESQSFQFSIDFHWLVVLKTFWHYRASVW